MMTYFYFIFELTIPLMLIMRYLTLNIMKNDYIWILWIGALQHDLEWPEHIFLELYCRCTKRS